MSEQVKSFQEDMGSWYRGIKEERERLKARIAELEAELHKTYLFLETQPVDCLGVDPEHGYGYRDEMIHRFKKILGGLHGTR